MGDTASLTGKTALVTGAAKRLGRGIALALAQAGANVVVHYNHSKSEAEGTAEGIRALGVRAWTFASDLSDGEQAEYLVSGVVKRAGPLDILVNSASIFPTDTLLDFTALALSENIQVNAHAPLVLSRSFFAQERAGCILNLLDTRIHDYDRAHVAYHLSKRMLFSLTRMLALEFAPRVRVNAVAPGLILPPPGEDASYLEQLRTTNPLEMYGSVEAVADAALYLIRASFVTGEVIHVDGGRHMKGNVYDGL